MDWAHKTSRNDRMSLTQTPKGDLQIKKNKIDQGREQNDKVTPEVESLYSIISWFLVR